MAKSEPTRLPQEEVDKLRSTATQGGRMLLFFVIAVTLGLMVFAFVWTRLLGNDFPIVIGEPETEAVEEIEAVQ